MSTIPMPEPVAWVRRHPDGALTAEFLEDAAIESVRKQSGAWLPMVTTTQAEAYAAAKVREALELAAQTCENQGRATTALDGESFYIALGQAARAIRALIPPLPGPASHNPIGHMTISTTRRKP